MSCKKVLFKKEVGKVGSYFEITFYNRIKTSFGFGVAYFSNPQWVERVVLIEFMFWLIEFSFNED